MKTKRGTFRVPTDGSFRKNARTRKFSLYPVKLDTKTPKIGKLQNTLFPISRFLLVQIIFFVLFC